MGHSCQSHETEASGQLYFQVDFIVRKSTSTPESKSVLNGRKVDLHVVEKRKIHVPVAYRTPRVGPLIRYNSD
jgi:hypothetical protein